MKNIIILGAGQLGSRHLQSLKSVQIPLEIRVIDPSINSLNIAQERYDSISSDNCSHIVKYLTDINDLDLSDIDIVIVATNSNVRRKVIENILNKATVNYFILEKLLFQRKEDYFCIQSLLKEKESIAFVNCSMRAMPFYYKIKQSLKNDKIIYSVSGSKYYLITNLIHYLDHIAYLSNCSEFVADTKLLEKRTINSSRDGYREIDGIFVADFMNGSKGLFTCYPNGNAPIIVQFYNENLHCISRESEGKVWLAKADNNWKWEEIEFSIPFQSQVTNKLVEQLLEKGTCPLVGYEESMKMHLILLESLFEHLNTKTEERYDYYPFT
jgi:hypothetical protein